MACLDDANFIISMIRHSSVTSDDTGMCEMVIVDEEHETVKKERRRLRGQLTPEEGESWDYTDYSQSFDIAVSPDMGMRTPKSQIRGFAKKTTADDNNKCKKISWKDRTESLNADEMQELFSKREVTTATNKPKKTSMLSEMLKVSSDQPVNPFREYSKFDGEAYQGTCETKTLKIFLTMLQDEERDIPMTVVVLGTASVKELVGLIMYKYVQEDSEPELQRHVSLYCLRIAEDDGEVDTDFPPLDNDEPISKFGFNCLALVALEEEVADQKTVKVVEAPKHKGYIVKVNEPKHGFSRFKIDSLQITTKEILAKMVKKRGLRRTGHEYVLEKASTPGTPIDLEETLESIGTFEFNLVKGNSKRDDRDEFSFTSHQYKCYRVNTVHKLRTGSEIQLGVYGEKIEIDPVMQPKAAMLWPRQKAATWPMDQIADCYITDSKNSARAVFKIVHYSNREFKHHRFETDDRTAREIVTKINHILDSRVSSVRAEGKDKKERSRKRHGTLAK